MPDFERIQSRLEHIRSVEPILGALRTISLGSWQAAQKRRSAVQEYGQRLMGVLPAIAPHVPIPRRAPRNETTGVAGSGVVLIVGSERGLCGRFNRTVVERGIRHLAAVSESHVRRELVVLGSRTGQIMERAGHPPDHVGKLSITTLPSFEMAQSLTGQWLERYERVEIDGVDVVYNTYRGVGQYESVIARLIPPALPSHSTEGIWPPPIIETDPLSLYLRVVRQWAAVTLHGLLLDAAVAEHAARFQLMEGASQNTARLIDELTLSLQRARQEAITREMQELAAGAGLIGHRGH